MSHFTVAVFTKTGTYDELDKLLAPYNEELEVEEYFDEDGEKTTYNPNSKWDWWSIGGRWLGMLMLKKGKTGIKGKSGAFGNKAEDDEYDSCRVSDIDFAAMKRRAFEKLTPFAECEARKWYKKEYFDKLYPTEQVYIDAKTEFNTYSVVTPDGKWHSSGDMGWFGCSSETPEEKHSFQKSYYDAFIQPAIDNDWYITIVDCHI